MLRTDQTQLFKMEYDTRCDTFGCDETGRYMIGRPDGPLNMSHVLCETCVDSLVESVKISYNLHEKSVHAPKEVLPSDLILFETPTSEQLALSALEEARTHAELDSLIKNFRIEGIPSREEEGGKLHERKEAISKKLKKE